MNEPRTIDIPLPVGADLSEADLNVLRMACEAVVNLASGRCASHVTQLEGMAAEGWKVRTNLAWIARAERGKEYEEATGACRGEALCELCQLTGLHLMDGCP